MYCKNCFRKITSDSKFCRYCGTEVVRKKSDHKKIKLIALIAVAMIVVAAAVGFVVKNFVIDHVDSTDYSNYIGLWQEENSDDVESKGGVKLQILSVDGDRMTISFGIYEGGGAYNGVEVESVNAIIEDGKAVYSFADDGYGNSGKGTLVFEENSIEWESKINKDDVEKFQVLKVASEETTSSDNMEESWQQ